MTELTGQQFLGRTTSTGGPHRFHAVNAATGELLAPEYADATAEEIDAAVTLADSAFEAMRTRTPAEIAGFLDAIAARIETLGDELIERAHTETGLPVARLASERARTTNQARLFASMVREGSWIDARIDHADPERKPVPKPDVRRMLVPIGPVTVFGASNFPLAISVAGSDTISAFGAGCPVIVKAHPAHPGTSELVARAILAAAEATSMPDGVFSLVHGVAPDVGRGLVRHPLIEAVAFTGSLRGGRSLFDAACARDRPIPVYAEMGSVNPLFLLPAALGARAQALATGFVQSVTLGVGQYCTNPGLAFAIEGPGLDAFLSAARSAAAGVTGSVMLHSGIQSAFDAGVARIDQVPGVRVAARSSGCALHVTDAFTFEAHPELADEVFGPSSLVVTCRDRRELEEVARELPGQLTATFHAERGELEEFRSLVRILERKVGRLIFNGFPTGIEVCAGMHHGGPYPATTDVHSTSIGTAAILRFARPLCYQSCPDSELPEPLREANPRGIRRSVDGRDVR